MGIRRIFFILVVCLLAVIVFESCDNSHPTSSLPDTTDPRCGIRSCYLEWKTSDSLEFYFEFGPRIENTAMGITGNIHLYVLTSTVPDGPWEIIKDTVDNEEHGSTYMVFTLPVRSFDLTFYRIDIRYEGSPGTRIYPGPMLATTKPFTEPESWKPGVSLRSGAHSGTSGFLGCMSEDRKKLFAALEPGNIYDLTTGDNITPAGMDSISSYGNDTPYRWIGNRIYDTKFGLHIYNLETCTWETNIYGYAAFFRNDSTVLILQLDSTMVAYNVTTGSRTKHEAIPLTYEWINQKGWMPRPCVSSPGYKYMTIGYSSSYINQIQKSWRIVDENYGTVRYIYPFNGYEADLHTISSWASNTGHSLLTYWDDTDNVFYFWSKFTGRLELWAYSIVRNKYYQITGYPFERYDKDTQFISNISQLLGPIFDPATGQLMIIRDPDAPGFDYQIWYAPRIQ